MASTVKKWGIGCGIGCGFLLLVFGGIGTCGYFGVRQVVDRVETLEETFDEMDAQFGRPTQYVPEPDGRILPERMEVFLTAREELTVAREDASRLMAELDGDVSGPAAVLKKVKAGMRFIPAMFDFIDKRNEVLLQHGMGLGEYQYLYALVFFDHLDKDPGDGPSFAVNEEADHEAGPVRWGVHGDGEEEDVRERREREIRRQLNKSLGVIAKNQLEALDLQLNGSDDAELLAWRALLVAEVEAMEREPRRILWDEGLPDALRESIEPYRDRLEESYGTLLNAIEMGLVNHQ